MNKIVLAILLFFSSLHVAHAQLEFTFGSDTISNANGTVDVDVLVSGFDDIVLMQMSFNWDADVFGFASIENVTTDLPEFSEGNIGNPNTGVAIEDGQLTLSWSKRSTEPETLPDGTRLFTIRLNGAGSVCGTTTMQVTRTPRDIEVFDVDFNEVTVTSSGGGLAILDDTCNNTGGGALGLTLGTVMGSAGSTVCIPVTATNFNDILSLSTGVLWDPNVLTYTELREGGLPSITANATKADEGELRVLWFFDQDAVTIPDGGTVFEICFEVTGNTGQSTQVSLGDIDDFVVEVSDAGGAINNIDLNNITFTVGGNGNNETGTGLIAPDIFTDNQTNVCIPVSTRNFNQVGALQTGISFDNSILTYDRVVNRGLSEVTIGNDATGGLRLLWQASFSQTNGVTLADDEVLFELCFDVIGSENERSEIGFVNLNNLDIEIITVDAMVLESFVNDGSITVGEEMTNQDAALSISSVTTSRGASVCVDVSGTGLSNIEGMGFTIEWDPSIITYVETRNFNLSELTNSAFNLSGNNRLVGVYTPRTPASAADGTSIFQICFQATTNCPDNTDASSVSFISGTTPNEIISNGAALNSTFNNGNVRITNCVAGGDLEIVLVNVNQPACANAASGLVSVDFNNATGTVMCLWRRDSDNLAITANCNLIGQPGGSYTLTASDQSGSEVSRTFVLNDPAPINIQGDVTDGTCSGGGAISVRVSGGTTANGSYGFTWSNGLPSGTAVQSDLAAGTYRVTVVDDNNCQTVQDFIVNDNSISLDPIITPLTDPDSPNGAIDLQPAATGLTFIWDSGQTTAAISGLNSGTYMVTITDPAANCTVERTFVVDAGFVSGSELIDGVTGRYNGFGVSCNGEQDGMLSGDIIGGCSDGPVSIFLNGNAITLPTGNLPAGDHVLRIEDACGNTFEESFTITEPDAIENTGLMVDCPSSNGDDGSITLSLAGGTGTYTLTSGVGTANGNSIEGLPVGVYTVIVEDGNGCQSMFENLEISGDDCNNDPGGPEPCGARSIITPNGDGDNDEFVIACRGNTPINNLTIYDRWGNLVMESTDYSNDWLGTDMSGNELPEGGYMWVLTTGNAGSRDIFRGTVTILR